MPNKPIIALIDLDCFYAQVEHNRLNISRDVPLAVLQWQGLIAVNYAARGRGLRSRHFGQELDAIREKCPDLVLVHTDTIDDHGITHLYEPNQAPSSHIQNSKISLQRYRTASAQIQSLIASYSSLLTIEKASIDEVFIDLSRLVDQRLKYNLIPDQFVGVIYEAGKDRIQPETNDEIRLMIASHIVQCIRYNVYRQLNYTCSAGIANGKAFAKLAAGMFDIWHKPFQQTILLPRFLSTFLCKVELTSIRGLGGKFGRILTDKLAVVHPSHITSKYTLDQLKAIFQSDKAEWLWQLCNGIDHEQVVEKGPAKSFQASRFFPKQLDVNDAENACRTLGMEIALRIAEDQEMYNRVPRYISLHTIHDNRTYQLTGYTAEYIISAAISMLHSLGPVFTPTKALSLRAYNFTNPELTNHKIEQFFKPTDHVDIKSSHILLMFGLSPALIIGLDRLLTSTVDHHSWLKGVIIALIASLCSSIGYCLQSLSQKNNLALPIQKQIAAVYQPVNLAGISLVVAESILECLALAYANESLLASIGLSTLAFNVILSPIINNEKATYLDWIIVGQIIAGVLITICAGPHKFQLLTLYQIEILLHTPTFHMFLIIVSTWTFALLYLTMIFDPADTSIGNLASVSRSQRYELHRLCLCALAGSLAGLTITAIRGAVSLIAVSFNNNNQFTHLGTWIFIITTILLAVANIITMNHAIGLYENLYVIPTKSVFEVFIGIGGGMFFYKESISLTYIEIAFFVLGLLICLSGLVVMLFASNRLPAYDVAYFDLADKSVYSLEKQSLIQRKIQI